MNEEIELIKSVIEKLRFDLAATNSALIAVMTSMSPEQQLQALKGLGQASAMKAAFVEKSTNPAERAALQPIQAAEERLYQALQNAHRLRMSQLRKESDEAP